MSSTLPVACRLAVVVAILIAGRQERTRHFLSKIL
jgi:hypothetical protein